MGIIYTDLKIFCCKIYLNLHICWPHQKYIMLHSPGNLYHSTLLFFGRNDAKAETLVLWPPHAKSWLIGKDSDAGRDWEQEEKGTTEDEMARWHHRLVGREFEWTPGVGDGQGGLACCDSWGHKESDTTEWLNWTELNWRYMRGFPGGASSKEPTCQRRRQTWTRFLVWKDSLAKGMATHSSNLAWRIPWKEEPGELPSIGS